MTSDCKLAPMPQTPPPSSPPSRLPSSSLSAATQWVSFISEERLNGDEESLPSLLYFSSWVSTANTWIFYLLKKLRNICDIYSPVVNYYVISRLCTEHWATNNLLLIENSAALVVTWARWRANITPILKPLQFPSISFSIAISVIRPFKWEVHSPKLVYLSDTVAKCEQGLIS